ncbi:MAG: hypothetical protein ACX94C_01125 [Phycisphaerales bacterium]
MLPRTTTLWACVIAAGSTTAHADIFTWFINSGMWEDPAMWNGPAGQYPDSILDTATISGGSTNATLGQNLAIGTLNVLNGAELYSNGNSIFVNADTIISGGGAAISVTQTPSLRDFDTDTLTMNSAFLSMNAGLAQFDEALIVNSGSAVIGGGTIEMNSTTGNIELNDGALWAQGGNVVGDTLRITRTNSSTAKLDWTSADSGIIVWDGKTLHNEIPFAGSLSGRISVVGSNGTARFISDYGFIAGANSEIRFSGGTAQSDARIEAPFVDSYGEINVSGTATLSVPLIALRGSIELSADSLLIPKADLINFHSIDMTSTGDNTRIRFDINSGGIINFKDGQSNIIMGIGSVFDLDGFGSQEVNIEEDASVWIEAEHLDYGIASPFDGTLNIDGSLHFEPVNNQNTFSNNGEISLTSGELTGRGIINDGIIRGTGSIEGYTNNNAEIIADGGTLQFGFVGMDGETGTGILRAQTGDLVMNMQSDGADQYFTGSLLVGDGTGIREVFNADVNLWVRDSDGNRGSLDLNSAFVVLHDFHTSGDMVVNGESLIRVTGLNAEDRISFSSGSVTTINGTLEADGNTWFVEGAQANGSGTLDIVSSLKGIYFQDGADLGDVSLISSGGIYLTDSFSSHASVHALTMRNTASLNASIYYSDFQQQTVSDKLTVQDHAILDGTLNLTNYPQGVLQTGETVTILEAASIEGEFDAIDFSALGPNRRAFVTITDTTVEVFITCFADINADGEADFFDASQFMNLFNQQDPITDMNNDGLFNFFDVSAFLSAYDLGC